MVIKIVQIDGVGLFRQSCGESRNWNHGGDKEQVIGGTRHSKFELARKRVHRQ
jgi:hypothetical protein